LKREHATAAGPLHGSVALLHPVQPASDVYMRL